MNDTLKVIYERRAVRKYKEQVPARSLIEEVISAGRMAPSAINRQPWKFYVLTNRADIQSFSKEIGKVAAKGILRSGIKNIIKSVSGSLHFTGLSHGVDFLKAKDPIFHGAPVVIFITSPKDNEWASLDIGMCSQNMMLAAKSLGLDTCPVGLGKYVEQTKSFPKLIISPKEQVQLAVLLGYGNEKAEMHERIKDNVVYY